MIPAWIQANLPSWGWQVFSLKAIVIILYRRLAFGAWQQKLLNFTVFLCICGFIATTLMLSLMCLPYSRRFQVQPLPDNNCTASSHFFIVLSCFNAVTDALLLAIPVPLLWTLRIPLHKRVVVFVLLSSGIFVMAACITRVSLTVVPNITVRIIARWGARELSIAMVAVNSASLRPSECSISAATPTDAIQCSANPSGSPSPLLCPRTTYHVIVPHTHSPLRIG